MISRIAHTTLAACIALILAGAAAFAGSLSIQTSRPGPITAKPRDLTSIPFVITNSGSDDATVLITADTGGFGSLVTVPKPVKVAAGSDKKVLLTFSFPPGAQNGDSALIQVTISRKDNDERAELSIPVSIETKLCASMDGLPEGIKFESRRIQTYSYRLVNCGDSEQRFVTKVTPGDNITIKDAPAPTLLPPGKSTVHTVTIIPLNSDTEYTSKIDIAVLIAGTIIAEKNIPVEFQRNVSASARNKQSSRFINMKVSAEHRMKTGTKEKTSLKFTLPTIREGGLTFRSNVSLDSGVNGFEPRRQTHELGFGPGRMILGNQQVSANELTSKRSEYDGLSISNELGNGRFAYFNGSEGRTPLEMYRWIRPLGKSADFALERSVRQEPNTPYTVTSNGVKAAFKAGKGFSFNAETAETSRSGYDGRGSKGTGYSVTGKYNKKNINVSIQNINSVSTFDAGQYNKGISVNASYRKPRDRFFINYQDQMKYVEYFDGSSVDPAEVPYLYGLFSAGLTHSIKQMKTAVTASVNSRRSSIQNQMDMLTPLTSEQTTMTVKAEKSFGRHAMLSTGIESGKETISGTGRDFKRYTISGRYEKDKLYLRTELISTDDMFDTEGRQSVRNRFRIAADYSVSKKIDLDAGYTKTTDSYYGISNSVESLFTIGVTARPSSKNLIRFEYAVDTENTARGNSFSTTFARNIDMKIPYKKNGYVYGAIYEDINGNNVYDSGDIPVKNAIVKLGGEYQAVTDESGYYEIPEVNPDKYKLTIDQSSFPVGITPSLPGPITIKIGSGKKKEINIAFNKLFTISGTISVDTSNYFARFKKISVYQIKILLFSEGKQIAETFTDAKGGYYFENLKAGNYTVMPDVNWLRQDTKIIGPDRIKVQCGNTAGMKKSFRTTVSSLIDFEASEIGRETSYLQYLYELPDDEAGIIDIEETSTLSNIDFSIGLKEKAVIKTFGK